MRDVQLNTIKTILFFLFYFLSVQCNSQPTLSFECTQPIVQQTAAPPMPKRNDKSGHGGLVRILVEIDSCGRVVSASIKQSSLRKELDEAALLGAKNWAINPIQQGKKVTSVIIPVNFIGRPIRSWPPVPKGCSINKRPDNLIKTPSLDQSGRIPDYIQDDCPIEEKTVRKARGNVFHIAFFSTTTQTGFELFETRDFDGPSIWYFAPEGHEYYPSVARFDVVNDGKREFLLTSHLCESTPSTCENFLALIKSVAKQPDEMLPPYISSFSMLQYQSIVKERQKP